MRASLVIVSILSLFGCGAKTKTKEQIAKEHPGLRPRLEKLVKAAEVADQHQWNGFDQPLEGPFTYNFEAAANNAIAVQRQDLADLSTDAKADLRFLWRNNDWVRIAKATLGVVTNEINYSNWSSYTSKLEELEHAKHVLVVIPKQVIVPGAGLTGEFRPGSVEGVALLVEIESGAFKGGFAFSAANRNELTVRAPKRLTNDARSQEYTRQVIEDLDRQFGSAVAAGISKRWPGAKAPSTFWTDY